MEEFKKRISLYTASHDLHQSRIDSSPFRFGRKTRDNFLTFAWSSVESFSKAIALSVSKFKTSRESLLFCRFNIFPYSFSADKIQFVRVEARPNAGEKGKLVSISRHDCRN
jgi:hypothetical protein